MGLWLGMIFYTFHIYLDFSAYSDMAIGMGRMVGFHYLENFDHPYMAKSIQSFWRKWHISLSSWFRDYVYIPLGGSRRGNLITVRNALVVWALTGFWHGASWNFVFWGLYYFVFLMLERFVIKDRMPKGVNHVYTILVVIFGWVLFRFTSNAELLCVLKGMLGFAGGGFINLQAQTIFAGNVFLFLFCIIACTDAGTRIRKAMLEKPEPGSALFKAAVAIDAITHILLLLLVVIALIGNSYNPFIYFRF